MIADAVRRDRFAALAAIVIAGAGLLAVAVSYSERHSAATSAEYYALLAAAGRRDDLPRLRRTAC